MPDLLRESKLVQLLLAEEAREVARIALEGRFGILDAEMLQALVKDDRATLKNLMRHFFQRLAGAGAGKTEGGAWTRAGIGCC